MRIAIGQINTTIGDFAGNLARIRAAADRARAGGADVLVVPELALSGYPPMDLLERETFLRDNADALAELASESSELAIVTGSITAVASSRPKRIANSAVALVGGEQVRVQPKTLLPTYDVFDESRYFQSARSRIPWPFRGRSVGLTICEDVWSGRFWGDHRPYDIDPVADLCQAGADLILTVSASPWEQRKAQLREAMLRDAAREHGVPIVFVNLVGGNDELVFDGGSFVVDARGRVVQRLKRFAEDFAIVDPLETGLADVGPEEDDPHLEQALVLGIRDYIEKLGLGSVVIGLSGGIDSAVTAWLATRALGRDKVAGLLMPGPFSSAHSLTDAHALASNLGIDVRVVRIDSIFKAFLEQFGSMFGPSEGYGLTQENLQARIRGTLLMAVSNQEGRIVLATGNKSELSVGYTTLYGDLVGGLAVLGDVLKRDVYRLAEYANRDGVVIPTSTIRKPPSAELAPDQVDSDALPPYPVLDRVLEQAIERGVPGDRIAVAESEGGQEVVRWILRQVDFNEYKRRQAPVVLRVSAKAFGSGRRLPIVHRSGWGV